MSKDQLPSPSAQPDHRAIQPTHKSQEAFWVVIAILFLFLHCFVLIFIAPKVQEMFISMDIGEVSLPMSVVFFLSNALKRCWFIIIPAFIAGGFALRKNKPTRVCVLCMLILGMFFYLIALFYPLIGNMDKLAGQD